MITAFNRETLASVRGMRKQSEIRVILGIHGIDYKMEVALDGPAVRTADGCLLDATYMFYIYVHKKDWRRARRIVLNEMKARCGAM